MNLELFWSKIRESEHVFDGLPCWDWTAANTGIRAGYGLWSASEKKYLAHRLTYALLIDDIPKGLDLDHLCRRRICCNPWHLDPVTRSVNLRRGDHNYRDRTHCKHGHEFAVDGYWDGKRRVCRPCRRAAVERFKARSLQAQSR